MRVRDAALDLTVDFAAGEELRTEVSAKFRPDGDRRGAGRGRLRADGVLDRPGRALRGHAGAGAVSRFTHRGPARGDPLG